MAKRIIPTELFIKTTKITNKNIARVKCRRWIEKKFSYFMSYRLKRKINLKRLA